MLVARLRGFEALQTTEAAVITLRRQWSEASLQLAAYTCWCQRRPTEVRFRRFRRSLSLRYLQYFTTNDSIILHWRRCGLR